MIPGGFFFPEFISVSITCSLPKLTGRSSFPLCSAKALHCTPNFQTSFWCCRSPSGNFCTSNITEEALHTMNFVNNPLRFFFQQALFWPQVDTCLWVTRTVSFLNSHSSEEFIHCYHSFHFYWLHILRAHWFQQSPQKEIVPKFLFLHIFIHAFDKRYSHTAAWAKQKQWN